MSEDSHSERRPALAQLRFASARSTFEGLSLQARFERIKQINMWGASESVSGLGSEQTATAAIREGLPSLVAKLGITSLLDAPCGDGSWIRTVELGIPYIGIEIVPELIENLQEREGVLKRRTYAVADLTADVLPRADAILCRDCLVHLSFANVMRALAIMKASEARFLLTTTFTGLAVNRDCDDGDWRPLNFERPPFSWPPPLEVLDERCSEAGGAYTDKALGIWLFEKLSFV